MSDDVVGAGVNAKNSASGGDKILVPLLPLRDIVVFPHMVVPLFVGREKSIAALEEAMNKEKDILLRPDKSENQRPQAGGYLQGRNSGCDNPALEAPRWYGQGFGGG